MVPNKEHVTAADLITALDGETIIGTTSTLQNDYQNSGFYSCQELISIEIPDTVTVIGDKAFYGASNLISVNIPSSVTEIGAAAFRTTALTSITVLSPSTTFGSNAFLDAPIVQFCGSEIGGRANVPTIDQSAQSPCVAGIAPVCLGGTWRVASTPITGATWVAGTGTLTVNDLAAFGLTQNCDDVLKLHITDPADIAPFQFYRYFGVTELTLPSGTTSIGFRAFYTLGYNGAGASVSLPSSLVSIGQEAFKNAKLTAIDLSGLTNLNTIGTEAFREVTLTSVFSVVIPNNVQTIEEGAFRNIGELNSVTLPDGLIEIKAYTFQSTALTSVTLPDSVTSIGSSAFYHVSTLNSVTIGDNVQTVGNNAFRNTALTNIIIPSSVTAIDEEAFKYSTLTRITVLSSSTTFGSNAFAGTSLNQFCGSEIGGRANVPTIDQSTQEACVAGMAPVCLGGKWRTSSMPNWDDATKTLTINDGTTVIADDAYKDCTDIEAVVIPSSVTEIGDYAFRDTTNLKSVDFSGATSLKTIGDEAFLKSGLTSVDLSNATSLEEIVDGVFALCRSLTSVTLPSSVTEIGGWVFRDTTNLKSVDFSGATSLKRIGSAAFFGATSLTSIDFSQATSLKTIGINAFNRATALTSITILSPNTTFGSNAFKDAPIVQFCGSEIGGRENAPNVDQSTQEACVAGMAPVCLGGKWRTSSMPNWDDATKTLTINDGTTVIADNAYKDCTDIEAVVIPDSVTEIGYAAFYNSGLTTVDFSQANQLETIGEYAFQSTSLTSITIPSSVETIKMYAFSKTKLTSIIIPGTVTTFGDHMFWDCEDLVSVDMSAMELNVIDDGMFRECTSLTSVVIPDSVTEIGSYAFFGTKLTSMTLPSNVTEIGSEAFQEATALTSVDFSHVSSLETIGSGAFQEATALESVILPDSVVTIGDNAFFGTKLTSMILPKSVTSIGTNAFPMEIFRLERFGSWNSMLSTLINATKATSRTRALSSASPQELRVAYHATGSCPNR